MVTLAYPSAASPSTILSSPPFSTGMPSSTSAVFRRSTCIPTRQSLCSELWHFGLDAFFNVTRPPKGFTVVISILVTVALVAAQGARRAGALCIIGVDLDPNKFNLCKNFFGLSLESNIRFLVHLVLFLICTIVPFTMHKGKNKFRENCIRKTMSSELPTIPTIQQKQVVENNEMRIPTLH